MTSSVRLICALALAASSLTAMAQEAAVPPKAAACIACHGPGGKQPIQADYPRLAGQTARYLYLQLKDYQEGRRESPLMAPMVAGLTRDEMREIAAYFAAQTPLPQGFAVDAGKARLGKAKSDETLCSMCHLGGFAGQNEVPRVAGQNFDYIVKQLKEFKARTRTNDAGTMTSVANTLSDADIENLAHYIAGL